MIENKWAYIDKNGKEITQYKYDQNTDMYGNLVNTYFNEGYALVRIKNKYGFVDTIGNEVIPVIYDSVHNFSSGLAKVELNKKRGFINNEGTQIIPEIYHDSNFGNFEYGYAVISLGNKYGIIDKKTYGEIVWE